MNKEAEGLIQNINFKINKLVSLNKDLREENTRLVEEKEELTKQLDTLSQKLKELDRQYKVLKFAKTISSGEGGDTQAKYKLSNLVREIDECIALLND